MRRAVPPLHSSAEPSFEDFCRIPDEFVSEQAELAYPLRHMGCLAYLALWIRKLLCLATQGY
jgi:hypothetical protein